MTNLTNMLCSNVLSSKRSIVVQVVALETLFCLHHSYTRGKHGQAKPRGQKVIEHAWIMSLTDISDACYYSPEQNALNYKWGPLSKCGANNTVAVIDLGCATPSTQGRAKIGANIFDEDELCLQQCQLSPVSIWSLRLLWSLRQLIKVLSSVIVANSITAPCFCS